MIPRHKQSSFAEWIQKKYNDVQKSNKKSWEYRMWLALEIRCYFKRRQLKEEKR